ncbi:MAG: hypothetical protein M1830_010231 [Pleopsidium flavum]|nr:MAG: hypothetical protein M1830_010231 [Pleopsidium flavum]
MAAGNDATLSAPHSFQQATQPAPQTATSPPSKRDLTSWWKQFKKNSKKEEEKAGQPTGIFGVPLQVSIRYANVAISLTNDQGESFVYGYVPIVVAKCGVFLKEKATDVEGIFRLSGSSKRIKDLQVVFDSPDRYGKGLDWTGYTVHDAANILRRYLNQLPEPIIPLDFYERFRDPLRTHQHQAVGDMEAQAQDVGDFNHEEAIITYQRLITEMPPLNRQLLLYILDLLAVFSSKSDLNRMTSPNLAAIFQPGMLSHPSHDMAPKEYRLSQDILIFLIENQDSFLIGMTGTAADEQTVKDVQSGAPTPQATTPTTTVPRGSKASLGRSASNASAGADSLRKFGGVRRNVSVSSKHSKHSTNVSSPVTPSSGAPYASNNTGSGVHRSNTLPSKKSPALSSAARFSKPLDPATPPSAKLAPPNFVSSDSRTSSSGRNSAQKPFTQRTLSASSSVTPTAERPPRMGSGLPSVGSARSDERPLPTQKLDLPALPIGVEGQSTAVTPTKERKVSSFFSKSPTSDGERKEMRQPNKLRKKRVPDGTSQSAHSSTNSLQGGQVSPDSPVTPPFHTPMPTPGIRSQRTSDPMSLVLPAVSNTKATPTHEVPPQPLDGTHDLEAPRFDDPNRQHSSDATLKPAKSPRPSLHSRSSTTDHSDFDQVDSSAVRAEKAEKRHRWRLSSSNKNHDHPNIGSAPSGSDLGSNAGAAFSSSSIGSSNRARKSITNDSQQLGAEPSSTGFPSTQYTGNESGPGKDKDVTPESEKKGPIGWLKAKVQQAKEERKEREAEKDRAKSPPRNGADRAGSRQSLSAVAQEGQPIRGRSMDLRRDEGGEKAGQPPLPHTIAPPQ